MQMQARTFTQTSAPKKRYYARVAGSRFCHDDGTETYFFHGFADISILEHQKELDMIVGKNPNIYIPEKLPEALPEVKQNALSEAELAAAEAANRKTPGRTAQEVGEVPANAGLPTDLNTSTVDIELQAAVFKDGPKPVGPGAIRPIQPATMPANAAASSVSKV